MAADYNAGDGLTEAVTACQTALATLQRLGQSDQADGPLTDAESSTNYAALDADRDHNDRWKMQRYAQTYTNVVSTLARRLTAAANAADKQDATDAANVFGVAGLPGDVASLSIARRDAADRIANVTDPAGRQNLLAQAVRNGDTTLARAIAQAAVESSWISPETVEACTMRSRYARDTEEVRSGVPGGCGPHRPGYRQADRPGRARPRDQCGHPGQLGCQGPRRT